MVAHGGSQPAGAMTVNDPHLVVAGKLRSVEKAIQRLERRVDAPADEQQLTRTDFTGRRSELDRRTDGVVLLPRRPLRRLVELVHVDAENHPSEPNLRHASPQLLDLADTTDATDPDPRPGHEPLGAHGCSRRR